MFVKFYGRIKKISKLMWAVIVAFSVITGIYNTAPTFLSADFIKTAVASSTQYYAQNPFSMVYLFSCLVALTVPTFLFFKTRGMLVSKGTRKIPVGFSVIAKKVNPVRTNKINLEIHEFQHLMTKALETIERRKYKKVDIFTEDGVALSVELLRKIKEIIELAICREISIHIKLFEKSENETGGVSKPQDEFLKTYVRVPSNAEHAKNTEGGLPQRDDSEIFKVIPGEQGGARTLKNRAKNNEFNAVDYRVNSAYNYVFGANEHHWLSNDLHIDEETVNFFSTSSRYEDYYCTLGVVSLNK